MPKRESGKALDPGMVRYKRQPRKQILLLLALVQHILGLGILVATGTFGRWRVVALFELSKIPLPQALSHGRSL
jgi:hypothetical protein